MKLALSLFFALATLTATFAQIKAVPGIIDRPADTLYIGYYVTTSLVFDATVWRADGGSKGVMMQKQPGLTNVLNLKANTINFKPTNLHVYTGDGKLFTFSIAYTPAPLLTTLFIKEPLTSRPDVGTIPAMEILPEQLNEEQLHTFIQNSRAAAPFITHKEKADHMIIKLRTIHYVRDWLFIGVELANHSTLPYGIDFIRLYVQDKEKIKRSSVQQREIIPIYKDAPQTISPDAPLRYVIVLPKFTLGRNKQFYLEIFEKNGGRHLALEIRNRHLLQAKPITYGSQK
jgi:conjugative transposon TraN protein